MLAIAAVPPAADPGASVSAPPPLQELDLPASLPGEHDLLVAVEAVGVNPVDTKVRAGLSPGSPPRVLGWDGCGRVEAMGAAVDGFATGDRVWFAGDITRPGCQAQRVAVDARIAARAPSNLSAAEAAALPLTALTAWEALFDRLGLDPDGGDAGRALLVLGGAGGVGSILIQLARRAGLLVIATASRFESQAWAREMGADHVLDHREPLGPQLQALGLDGVDLIANLHDTDAYWQAMAELIRPQGAIVAIVGNRAPLDLDLLKSKSVRFCWEFMFTRPRYGTADMGEQGRILARVTALVEAGELRTTLRETLRPIAARTLEQAHGLLASGRTIGKIALEGWA
ncbi:zinc-binding alcohol dehydrogenase family protein [Cyanobium sp. FGCU-6]|nr:zinc-binding alcohol dehydrogenase family protein [Cyanobium sp. FGCU6]